MTSFLQNPARVFALIAAGSLAVVGAALVLQHAYDMQPCPWCVLQRLVYLAIALAALLGLAWRSAVGRIVAALIVGLLAGAGIAAALWQHFVAAATDSCNLTLADKIVSGLALDELAPEVFAARASCADASVALLGVPFAFWSLAAFALLGGLAVSIVLGPRK